MSTPRQSIVVLLHPGELGTALGRILQREGHRIVVYVAGRGSRTQERARTSGFECVPTLAAAAANADLLLSVVPPSAAPIVLDAALRALSGSERTPLFVDANSINPAVARDLERRCTEAGLAMVDMSVQGQAAGLPDRGDLFLSGAHAESVTRLFGGAVSTRVVGPDVGAASQFKMLLSALYKSQTALFLEACTNAHRAGVLPAYLETTRSFYPGMVTAVERVLPSYPRHAPRRAHELREVETLLAALDIQPHMVREARVLLERLASSPVCRQPESVPVDDPLSLLTTLVEALNQPMTQEDP